MVETYRNASADQKKIALKILKGEYSETVMKLLNVAGGAGVSSGTANNITGKIGDFLGGLLGK